ncbi:hypothetical protein HK097_000399 [Rhizophlyctis rosea]|uniref:Uncharacterized protein n=1 Tax=Rhizophlyctis rosea TaxID=64517 RepID=A0AAD5X217_9FUNG|nr:hypothetical protein HK097_000399 [Rhizophlyctis rosea]
MAATKNGNSAKNFSIALVSDLTRRLLQDLVQLVTNGDGIPVTKEIVYFNGNMGRKEVVVFADEDCCFEDEANHNQEDGEEKHCVGFA